MKMKRITLTKIKRKVRQFELAAFKYIRIDASVLTQEDVARYTKVKRDLYKLLNESGLV